MEKSGATAGDVKIKEYTFFQYTFHFLRSNCRQKHIKSNFFAYMRPVSDFIITVREQKPDFFSNPAQVRLATFTLHVICGSKSNAYPMFLKATAVWMVMLHYIRLIRHTQRYGMADMSILSWEEVLTEVFKCLWSPSYHHSTTPCSNSTSVNSVWK